MKDFPILARCAAAAFLLGVRIAAAECIPDSERMHPIQVRLEAPQGAEVSGVTLVVDYPVSKVVLPGTGRDVSKDSVRDTPSGGILIVDDADDSVKVAVAHTNPLDQKKVMTIRFKACAGAEAPKAADYRCTVVDAADMVPNALNGVRCSVVPVE